MPVYGTYKPEGRYRSSINKCVIGLSDGSQPDDSYKYEKSYSVDKDKEWTI